MSNWFSLQHVLPLDVELIAICRKEFRADSRDLRQGRRGEDGVDACQEGS